MGGNDLVVSKTDHLDRLSLGLVADVGVVLVDDIPGGSEDGQDDGLWDTGFGAMGSEGMAQAMEAVDRHLLLPSGDLDRGVQADPTDHTDGVDVDQVVPGVLPQAVGLVVAVGDIGTDIGVPAPLEGLLEDRQEPGRDWDRDILASLVLLDPDHLLAEIDRVPLEQHTVLEPLAGEHPDVVDHPKFRLVQDLILGVVENLEEPFLLFPGERLAAGDGSLFLPFLPKQRLGQEWVVASPIGLQDIEDLLQPADLPVVGIDREILLPHVFGVGPRQLWRDLLDGELGLADEVHEFLEGRPVGLLFADRGRNGPVRVFGVCRPGLVERQALGPYDPALGMPDVFGDDLGRRCLDQGDQRFRLGDRLIPVPGLQADCFAVALSPDLVAEKVNALDLFLEDSTDIQFDRLANFASHGTLPLPGSTTKVSGRANIAGGGDSGE